MTRLTIEQRLRLAVARAEEAEAALVRCVAEKQDIERRLKSAEEETMETKTTKTYRCQDQGGDELVVATSPEDAAKEFVESWGMPAPDETEWYDVLVRPAGEEDEETVTVTVHPEPPSPLPEIGVHVWGDPIEIVGGIKESPGVWGHGGGVVMHDVCLACGLSRVTDTWAQNMATGEQGLRSVSYVDRDREDIELLAVDGEQAAVLWRGQPRLVTFDTGAERADWEVPEEDNSVGDWVCHDGDWTQDDDDQRPFPPSGLCTHAGRHRERDSAAGPREGRRPGGGREMSSYQITYGHGGHRIEWYRDDDANSGYGGNAEVAYWYGTRAECESRAQLPPDPSWWVPAGGVMEGPDRTDPGYWKDNY